MATVLTVEDHVASRDHLASMLRYGGHEVLEASDGQEGLQIAHATHPDLVIADLLMPTMDGIEFVRRLRSDPETSQTPVLFVTAPYRVPEAEGLVRQSGASGVLPKTAGAEDVLRTVGQVLGDEAAVPPPRAAEEHQRALSGRLLDARGESDRVSQRLAAIVDASNELLAFGDPVALLRRLTEIAREIVGCRYAVALTTGVDDAGCFVSGVRLDAGDLGVPAGGVLARLCRPEKGGPAAVRLERLSCPADAGLSPRHPPVRSLLATRLSGHHGPIGLLYCADKIGADAFTGEDEYLLASLAGQAATVYEKTRLLAESERRARELAEEAASRKRAEERLLHAQKMESIGKLAGGISHDFNNLLTVIKGYGEILMTQVRRGDPLYDPTCEILGAAERAASLVRQLLAFSRRQVLAPALLDLNSVVASMDRLLRRLIGEDIELVSFPGPGLGPVKVDPSQVEQVIVNLAVNARDAMPSGGKLTLELANADLDEAAAKELAMPPGPYVRLAVTDTGVGMTRDVMEHIFEPFFTTKESGKGTGLGLATVYGIVKQSGGHITVYSEVGHGTTFKLYLPRVNEPMPRSESAAVDTQQGGSETVLLVEDEAAVRRLARQMLRSAGYTVLEAANGSDALRVADEHAGRIDLVVTDLVMPGLGGQQLITRLRQRRPDARVLFMSGYAGNAVLEGGALESGAAFIEKPFTPLSFLAKVREVLDAGR